MRKGWLSLSLSLLRPLFRGIYDAMHLRERLMPPTAPPYLAFLSILVPLGYAVYLKEKEEKDCVLDRRRRVASTFQRPLQPARAIHPRRMAAALAHATAACLYVAVVLTACGVQGRSDEGIASGAGWDAGMLSLSHMTASAQPEVKSCGDGAWTPLGLTVSPYPMVKVSIQHATRNRRDQDDKERGWNPSSTRVCFSDLILFFAEQHAPCLRARR